MQPALTILVGADLPAVNRVARVQLVVVEADTQDEGMTGIEETDKERTSKSLKAESLHWKDTYMISQVKGCRTSSLR
jgi:hypothetical protein